MGKPPVQVPLLPERTYLETLSAQERSLQRVMFYGSLLFVCVIVGGYSYRYWESVEVSHVRLRLLALYAGVAALSFWAHRRHRFDVGLTLLWAAIFVFASGFALAQGPTLPAAGWWLSVTPFILAGAGLFRESIAFVFAFVALVSYMNFAPGYVMPEGAAANVTPMRTYVAIVGSELLALGAILMGMVRRRRAMAALKQAQVDAEQAGRAKADFLANMSHEIRTPLNGIIGAADLLTSPRVAEAQRLHLQQVQRQSAHQLLALLNDVLDYSKLDAGRVELERRPVSLKEIVLQATELFSVQAFDKGLELTASCGPDLPEKFAGDAARIRQVVNNLVANAIKFTASGGVHVSADIDHDESIDPSRLWIQIAVRDSGPGMTPEEIAKLFSAYAQADESVARRFGGTGLGLSIAKGLVTAMSGTVGVDSKPGVGSVFFVRLPLEVLERGPRRDPAPIDGLLVACATEGLERHMRWKLREAGVAATCVRVLPDATALAGVRKLMVDAALLPASDAASWIASLEPMGVSLVIITPLGSDTMLGAPDGARLVLKPVRAAALRKALDMAGAHEDAGNAALAEVLLDKGLRILVADDNPVNQLISQAMLGELELTCDLASDGDEALEMATLNRYDLILLDLEMPRMSGLACARAIREHEQSTGTTPTIIYALSASIERSQSMATLEAGMNGFLSKPFGLNQLRQKLETVSVGRAQ